jgi:ribulose-5-phosphate 4-epimerase/fuculose-1-phosphate aldolase
VEQLPHSNQPQEGVIQYRLDFQLDHDINCLHFAELNSWRSYFYRLGLVGQDGERYGGLGYGNVSHRVADQQSQFVISGTQTGHLPLLCREHYVLVEEADVSRNQIVARGPIKPSSEALTHAALYHANPDIQCVLHVHSPLVWQRAGALQMPSTPAHVPYGTPAMAEAVRHQLEISDNVTGVIAMLGHEDGIIAYSSDVESAGTALMEAVMNAHGLDEHYFNAH